MQISPEHISFWYFNIGNVVSWLIVAAAWYTAYLRQHVRFQDKITGVEKWVTKHDTEADERDKLIQQLTKSEIQVEQTLRLLEKLCDTAEVRLTRLESMYFRSVFPAPPVPPEKG